MSQVDKTVVVNRTEEHSQNELRNQSQASKSPVKSNHLDVSILPSTSDHSQPAETQNKRSVDDILHSASELFGPIDFDDLGKFEGQHSQNVRNDDYDAKVSNDFFNFR